MNIDTEKAMSDIERTMEESREKRSQRTMTIRPSLMFGAAASIIATEVAQNPDGFVASMVNRRKRDVSLEPRPPTPKHIQEEIMTKAEQKRQRRLERNKRLIGGRKS